PVQSTTLFTCPKFGDHYIVLLVVRGMILAKRIPTSLTGIPVTINQDLKALKPDETWISPIYLKLLFDGLQAPLASLIEESAHGTKCFRTDLLTTFKVPLPPLPEQTEIISLLSRERTRTAELEETLHRSIALLKERRSALITAAVTGQLQISDNQSNR
ncbi:MAG: restriction endonuclease subunit S, partial [Candidatus Contendobacter sp.]|nr:restriction endonuclease subunit S [Candidatus Contendobacter sp.]